MCKVLKEDGRPIMGIQKYNRHRIYAKLYT